MSAITYDQFIEQTTGLLPNSSIVRSFRAQYINATNSNATNINAANINATNINATNIIVGGVTYLNGSIASSIINTATSNQLKFQPGAVGRTLTINVIQPSVDSIVTLPDPGTNASVIYDVSAQTISGVKTFSAAIVGSVSGTATNITGVVAVANGGTNSSTVLNNNRIIVSSGGSIVEAVAATNGQLLIGSAGTAPVISSISGTANQIIVTNGPGSIVLSLPQNIGVVNAPTFANASLTAVTNQLTLGTTTTATINASAPAASRVYTISDPGLSASFVMTEGVQTINGSKTFSGTTLLSGTVKSRITTAAVTTTITAAQVIAGIATDNTTATAVSCQLPTSAALVAALPGVAVGDVIICVFVAYGSNTNSLTLTTNTGLTLLGTPVVLGNTSRTVLIMFTNVTASSEAVSVY